MLILVSLQRVKNEKNQETKQKGHINFFLWNSAKKKVVLKEKSILRKEGMYRYIHCVDTGYPLQV